MIWWWINVYRVHYRYLFSTETNAQDVPRTLYGTREHPPASHAKVSKLLSIIIVAVHLLPFGLAKNVWHAIFLNISITLKWNVCLVPLIRCTICFRRCAFTAPKTPLCSMELNASRVSQAPTLIHQVSLASLAKAGRF